MTRALPILLLLALAAPASADPVDDLARILRASKADPYAVMPLLRGIAALPDFELGSAQVLRVMSAADVAPDSLLGEILLPTVKVVKRGGRLELFRNETTRVTVGKGVLEL